jgi:hypothetical protein
MASALSLFLYPFIKKPIQKLHYHQQILELKHPIFKIYHACLNNVNPCLDIS